ncbi:hypothetical protein DUI87_05825 [Hirundo rustica rustica]|uniref:RNase H type-1 domain-containing protein n=1 Tax=Hirundo rustica rustica TaxID=333673 RepID=A0A3M0LDN5_HIRRU|nr:hypothetical protein DUI87_05825 [Hirundo rustica rustica]
MFCAKFLSSCLPDSLKLLEGAIRPSLGFLFSRLNSPSLLSLSPQQRYSNHLIIFRAVPGTRPNASASFLCSGALDLDAELQLEAIYSCAITCCPGEEPYLYPVTASFLGVVSDKVSPEPPFLQQQAFAQIKQEIAHAVALGPVRTGPDVKNVLYSAAGNNGLSWSLWQKVPGRLEADHWDSGAEATEGQKPIHSNREGNLAAYEGVQAASEVIGTEAQLLLATPDYQCWGGCLKEKFPPPIMPPTPRGANGLPHHSARPHWKPKSPWDLEIITNWPEGENFGLMDEEEQEQVTRAEEAPPYNQLPAEETRYALFTDGSCRVVGMNRKWEAAVWSPTRQVAQATEGEGGSSQLAELKAVSTGLDIAEREKWPKLYLYY